MTDLYASEPQERAAMLTRRRAACPRENATLHPRAQAAEDAAGEAVALVLAERVEA